MRIKPIETSLTKRLALNEKRPQFSPSLWRKKSNNKATTMSQVWFPGVHRSVGGGDVTCDLSSISLAWMVQKLHGHTSLECDLDYVAEMSRKRRTSWAIGDFRDSCRGLYKLGGWRKRKPGRYYPVAETFEAIHSSVRKRKEELGHKFATPDLGDLPTDEFGDVESRLRWEEGIEIHVVGKE